MPVLHQIKFHTCVLSLNSLDSLGLLSSSCNECSPEVDRMKLLFQFKSQFILRALLTSSLCSFSSLFSSSSHRNIPDGEVDLVGAGWNEP